MIVLGLDISRSSTGVAIGDASGPPRVLRARFSGSTHGQIAWAFQRWLREFIIINKPDLICGEGAFMHPTDDLYTAKLMLGLDVMAQATAAMRGIEYQTVAVQTWRKAFLGHGRPENPKRAAIRMCKQLGWDVDGSHDKAEAAGIWAYGHLYHGDGKAMRQLLSGSAVRSFAAE